MALPNADAACGPVQVQWRTGGRAWVPISDIVYTLRLRTAQVDVALKQGAMQIDGFSAMYEWDGATLRFVDAEKNVRHELQTQAPLDGQAAASAAARR